MAHTGLLVSLAAALVAAFVGGFLATRLRLPPILGYLLAGVVIGPFTPGFNADPAIASELAEVGVVLLMFGVGIHFSLRDLLAVRRIVVPGAAVTVTTATLLGMAAARGWGWPLGQGLVLGLSICVASTVVLLRALEDRGALTSPHGHTAIGWLIVEDLFTVLALVLLPALAGPLGGTAQDGSGSVWLVLGLALVKAAAFVALMFVVGRRAVPWLLVQVARLGSRELFTLAVLAIALGIAIGSAELFDVSLALGAFLAGVVVGESDLSHHAAAEALPMRDAFAVLFFVSVGMLLDPMVLLDSPEKVLALLAIVMLGKPLAAFAIVRLLGHPPRTGLTVAAGLAQIGEFSFILATVAGGLGLMPAEGTNLILAVALISITLNPVLFFAVDPVEAWLRRRSHAQATEPELPALDAEPALRRHAVICGYGPGSQVLVGALERRGFRYLVIEPDRRRVEALQARGVPALYGDPARPAILEHAGVPHARVLVVTLGDAPVARRVVEIARRMNARLDIVVETHSQAERQFLVEHGAGEAVLGEWETALELTRRTLHRFGLDAQETRAIVQGLRAAGPPQEEPPAPAPARTAPRLPHPRLAPRTSFWTAAAFGLTAATLLALLLEAYLRGLGAGWLYLFAVLPLTLRWGRVAGAIAAVVGALLLLVVVIEPRLSLFAADPWDYLRAALTFAAMLVVVLTAHRRRRPSRVPPI